MSSATDTGRLHIDSENNRVDVIVEKSLYPLDAIYGAAYVFVDRCYLLLDAPDATTVKVSLSGREALEAEALRALAGEFANELLAQAWRRRVVEQNQPVIEAVAARALAGSLATPPLDNLDRIDFSADAFDDPLGIAVPWEEKYGKQTGETDAADAADRSQSSGEEKADRE